MGVPGSSPRAASTQQVVVRPALTRGAPLPLYALLAVAMLVALSGCAADGATPGAPAHPIPMVTPAATPAVPAARVTAWEIRAVDTMKLSRDTLKTPLGYRDIVAVTRLDARLHLTHIAVDVYYDAPAYLARWVRAVRAAGLSVWFRAHWYAWENHRDRRGHMTPGQYIAATRRFLQRHATLLRNGDIFDYCSEPENGAYWLQRYGHGWSWRDPRAKHAFNVFIRAGVHMAATTLAHRGRGGVIVTAISVNPSIALRLLSKPTVRRLGFITLDLYPERRTRDPATAARRLIAQLAVVRRRWNVPLLLGEHGYARDMPVTDATQARVLAAELDALARLGYLRGMNYWVDAGGVGYGGYTNLYRWTGHGWTPRPAAGVLARAFAAATPPARASSGYNTG